VMGDMERYTDFNLHYLVHMKRKPALFDRIAASTDITFVHKGEYTYIIDGKPVTIHAGEAFYCAAGFHRKRLVCDQTVSYTALNFVYRTSGDPLPFAHRINADSPVLDFYLSRLLHIYHEGHEHYHERCNLLLGSIVYELLELNQNHSAKVEYSRENEHVAKMKALITADLSQRITVEKLAAQVHLYPSYCSELFHEETGQTISEYAMHARISLAQKLLIETEQTIGMIAEYTGFCDRFYFARAFRKQTGMTPTDFRKQMRFSGILPDEKILSSPKK